MAKTSYVPGGARIKVIGLGGAGCNAVTRMVREQIRGVEFIAMNTDAQALAVAEAPQRIQLGERMTRGLGAGGDNHIGRRSAEESVDEIRRVVEGSDMVFVAAGMGGGTGTGSAPVVAQLAKRSGALTIGVVSKPFTFEGVHRKMVAEEGIRDLMQAVDTLIIIPNDKILQMCDARTNVDSAFKKADECLQQGVQAIAEVITVPGLINLDFADVGAIMKNGGPAWMSIGHGGGQNRATQAAREALSSPLLDVSMQGATGVLFNISGADLTIFEVNEAAELIKQAVHPDANIIFGVVVDPHMHRDVRLTLIATGFASKEDLAGLEHEREIMDRVRSLKEEELDMPAYARGRARAR